MRRFLLLLIRGYQRLVSPLTPPSCRFMPTCSQYAAQAVAEHGALAGSLLAVRRLLRCHPLCSGGYDPVPPAPHHCRAALRALNAKPGSS